MNIGIPKERLVGEHRVGLTPAGVGLLVKAGHACFVESEAGAAAGFDDYDYERQGATIVHEGAEVYQRSDLVLKVQRPMGEEIDWMHDGQIILGFLGLMAAPREELQRILQHHVTTIAYEMVSYDGKHFPILTPMSEVAGRLAPSIAGTLLMQQNGGRGILLSGVPGISAGDVVILGAGALGTSAARTFVGLGAKVFVLSPRLDQLREIDALFQGRVTTMVSHDFNIDRTVRFADVVIGAVRVPGKRPPILITRQMLRSMRKGSVILDFSIDHGGCVETSHPTTLESPTFIEEDIVHYCVPNVPGAVPRTSTHAFNNAAWPYIRALVEQGPVTAIAQDEALKRATVIRHGDILDADLASMV